MWGSSKPAPLPPLMAMPELAMHTFQVVVGQKKAYDWSTAQPVGLNTKLDAFLFDMTIVTIGMYFMCWVWEETGAMLARACGLKRGKVERFASSFVELVYYSLSLTVGLMIFKGCDWLYVSAWGTVVHDGRVQLVSTVPYMVPADAKFAYLMECAWVLSGFTRLMTRKAKKDFYEMLFHHVVTFTLLMLSYMTGYIRVGAVVYLLHNTFDPFLHMAKCTHYIKIPVIPDISFALCAVIFLVSRLYYYPLVIYQAWIGVCAETSKTCLGGVWGKNPVETLLCGFLAALLPIHCLWFYMICRVIKNSLVSAGVQGDVRSDSEDEDEGEDKKKK